LSSACRVAVRRKNSTLWTTPLTVWHIRGWRIRWRDQTVGHWYTIQQTGVQTKRIQSLKSLWQININCKTTRVKCEVNAWQICRWIWTSEKPNQCVEWKLLLKGCLSWLGTSVFSQREQPESYCLSFSCHIKFNGIENKDVPVDCWFQKGSGFGSMEWQTEVNTIHNSSSIHLKTIMLLLCTDPYL
jgi:hypothetical protein